MEFLGIGLGFWALVACVAFVLGVFGWMIYAHKGDNRREKRGEPRKY